MLGYNRTITITNINVLLNIGPRAGEGREKKRGKRKTAFPTILTIIVVLNLFCFFFWLKGIERNFKSCCGGQKKEKKMERGKNQAAKQALRAENLFSLNRACQARNSFNMARSRKFNQVLQANSKVRLKKINFWHGLKYEINKNW